MKRDTKWPQETYLEGYPLRSAANSPLIAMSQRNYIGTTLCQFCPLDYILRRLENYTCMTSWRRESPRINIAYMFKERTFWNFLCIISCAMLPRVINWKCNLDNFWSSKRPCKALWSSETIFPTVKARRIPRRINLQLVQESTTSLQVRWNLTSGLHYARLYGNFYMCFLMMPGPLGEDLQRWRQWPENGNSLLRPYWVTNQSKRAGRIIKCGEKLLIVPVCFFCDPDYIMQKFGVYTCMKSLWRVGPCVSIEHMVKKGTF